MPTSTHQAMVEHVPTTRTSVAGTKNNQNYSGKNSAKSGNRSRIGHRIFQRF